MSKSKTNISSNDAGTVAITLAKVPIFSGLTEGELAFLLQRAVPRHYAAGEIVFGEGEPCLGLYVVESGHIRIYKSSSGGREHVLSVDGPGSSVAELPVFDGGNYPASVAAIDDATLLFVSKQDFHALCLTHPQVALKVLRVVGARLRKLVGIIEELSFTTVRHRLASFLLRLAQTEGKQHPRRYRGHSTSQQPGVGLTDRDRPRTRLTQSQSAAGGGSGSDRWPECIHP
ncbi:MAG: Crp/Fnr family transcriptional regulator [Candidatus Sulfotelmatobacter sp.]